MKSAVLAFASLSAVVAFKVTTSGDTPAAAATDAPAAGGLSAKEAGEIAADAYVFAYPLVTMYVTEGVQTNTVRATATKAPVNQFAHFKQYPDPSNHLVTTPNADTLYSMAWLDLSKEPLLFSHPDMGERFYMFPMLDAYTNVLRTPGTRDDGGAAATYVVTGPGWKGGKLPDGAREIKSPTNMVWILGRTYCTGTPEDYAEVHKLQAKYELRPLSATAGAKPPGGKVDPKIDGKTAVRDQVNAMTAAEFFALAAQLMGPNPPATADAPMVARFARIGLVPGQPFKTGQLPPDVAMAVEGAPKTAQERIKAQGKVGARDVNGWMIALKAGTYGTDYVQRAFITAVGLGANVPQQAIYPLAEKDAAGLKFEGKNPYIIRFAPGELPPAKGFWSITMYTPDMFFFTNPLRRYTVSSRTKFHENEDGSVDVVIQNQKPTEPNRLSNWLPAPREGFLLVMRLYWPDEKKPSILDGSWKPPPVTQASVVPRVGRTPPRR